MMMERGGNKGPCGDRKGETGVLSDADAVLVEEFVSLVAEIAARSLTGRRSEPHNGGDADSRG
jgi:hypothetical protein